MLTERTKVESCKVDYSANMGQNTTSREKEIFQTSGQQTSA